MATAASVYHAPDIEGGGNDGNRGMGMKWTPATMALMTVGVIALVFPYVAIPVLFAVYKPNSGTSQQVTSDLAKCFFASTFYLHGSTSVPSIHDSILLLSPCITHRITIQLQILLQLHYQHHRHLLKDKLFQFPRLEPCN